MHSDMPKRNRSKWNSAIVWRQLRLRVRDDGKGIDATFLTAEGVRGALRPHGMRERAKLMAAADRLDCGGSGTEIELIIPAAHALRRSSTPFVVCESFSGKRAEQV